MFNKPKGWLTGAIWKPKNLHSLEHLKFLYSVLCKNQTVTEQNKSLLVETLRSISEILIWGDQNDSSVFDFFLEKNMLAFFLRFMRQKSGRYLCVQLLQLLNILFENIRNETSVYYLLSNNHINSIIVHKFDFSDEEVMAYYISFLKTLSLKLNKHTIHFFYNEHTNDFALYTEAIKFFNHPESMVRIAVRTITLNVYKVDDKSMLRYIRDKTAAPYFSNLVWFIGNHIIELDSCVRNDADHNSRNRLADLVAEHLDHLHYLNDILCLNIDALNEVLTDHLLNRLLIPLYVYSLTKRRKFSARTDDRPHVSSVVSLFLLSQVFLIISHVPLVRQLADIIFNGDIQVCMGDTPDALDSPQAGPKNRLRGFLKPPEPLAKTLETNRGPGKPIRRPNYRNAEESGASPPTDWESGDDEAAGGNASVEGNTQHGKLDAEFEDGATDAESRGMVSPGQNSTDEEKLLQGGATSVEQRQAEFSLKNKPYLEAVFSALECSENDYEALFTLCLLYAMGHNLGLNQELLDTVLMPTDSSETKDHYNIVLIEKLIQLINLSCQTVSKVRLATLEMSTLLLKQLVYMDAHCFLQDRHLAAVEGAREESTLLLRNFYKSEEIFLDMFEDEYRDMKNSPLNVEYLTMDASILLPPTGTPLTGIEFNKRLPCGEVERARRAIRVFFLLRHLSLTLRQEEETSLPLTKQEECVKVTDALDLNNSDLIACTVITRDQQIKRERRFLVIDLLQLILVEPDTRRLGWGVVKFVGFLQDVEVTGDKDDSRSLHITIHKPSMNMHARPLPLLSSRFVFDDHIRCMAAKQRLTKGRLKARQRKMQMIARLLELPTHIVEAIYQAPQYPQSATSLRTSHSSGSMPGRLSRHPGQAQGHRNQSEAVKRSVYASSDQVPGFTSGRSKDHQPRKSSSKRTLSQPIPIRVPAGGPVRQMPGAAAKAPSTVHQGSPEIEEAQEATPSPEAHAFKSLNSSAHDSHQEQKSGRGSRSSSSDRTPAIQEIPLEDMSKQAKAAKAKRKRVDSEQKRSSSHSPHRNREPKTPPSPRGTPVGSRSRAESRKARTSSVPLAKEVETATTAPKDACSITAAQDEVDGNDPDEAKEVEGASEESTQKEDLANDADDESTPPKLVTRSRSSSGSNPPASLTPAQEPSVSLLETPAAAEHPMVLIAAADIPQLLPPMEVQRIHSLNDPATMTSPSIASTITDPNASPSTKPKVPFAIDIKCPSSMRESPTRVTDVEKAELEENASEHLTNMAQQLASRPPASDDPNDIPLSPTTAASSNVVDGLPDQEQ